MPASCMAPCSSGDVVDGVALGRRGAVSTLVPRTWWAECPRDWKALHPVRTHCPLVWGA
ncbi:unspecified product [Leishmania tarentolae]|uniref:Unspecified product n=1 Tax=Leishmania tarentolae TaxID=5689 RepID=A0A640KXD1_LEITA|nr:unspecified product [Leishmania tarentolae]